MKTTFLKLKTAVDFNAEAQRWGGVEEDEENSVSLCLCVSVIKLTQRHKGRESHFFDRINRIDKIRK